MGGGGGGAQGAPPTMGNPDIPVQLVLKTSTWTSWNV